MPRLNRIEPEDLKLNTDRLHLIDVMCLELGHHDEHGRFDGIEILTIDDARAWYEQCEELWGVYEGGSVWEHPRPGVRYWGVWYFHLLPDDPRQRVVPEYGEDPTTTDPPSSCHYIAGPDAVFEGSFRYLKRRGLLTPAEVDALQSDEMAKHWLRELEYRRRYGWTPNCVQFTAHQLADIRLACDPDGKHNLLTPDELERAEPYL